MEKRIKALEDHLERLTNKISDLEFKFLNLQKVHGQRKVPAPADPISGAKVWEHYEYAFLDKYKVRPVRNAKINKQCLEIQKRLGKDAPAVTAFYVTLNDPQFVRLNHPIGLLLLNCESIQTMWTRGSMTTSAQARTVEKISGNVVTSTQYLERKHGIK